MWDERYSSDTYFYGTDANDFLVESYTKIPKGKVLCLAEGEGRNAVFLAKQGYSVTAVDMSSVGLNKAKKLAASQGVHIETICADLADFDLGTNEWDGIVSIFCHLPSHIRQSLHARIQTALKPSGVFLLEGYAHEQLSFNTGGSKQKDMLYSVALVKQELPSLSFDYLAYIEREIHEGDMHSGMSAVVQGLGSRSIHDCK